MSLVFRLPSMMTVSLDIKAFGKRTEEKAVQKCLLPSVLIMKPEIMKLHTIIIPINIKQKYCK